MKIGLPLALLLTSAACAPAPRSASLPPSGIPEITVAGKTRQQVVDAILKRQLANGWELARVSYSEMVFTRKARGLAADLVFGQKAASLPEVQAAFIFAELDNGFRISARETVILDAGTPEARATEMTGSAKEALMLQAALNEIGDALSSAR